MEIIAFKSALGLKQPFSFKFADDGVMMHHDWHSSLAILWLLCPRARDVLKVTESPLFPNSKIPNSNNVLQQI